MAKLESDQLITQQGKLGQRLELLGREAEILPEISKAYTDIGNAMWEKGDHLEAIEMWERATELSATLVENLNEIDGITHSFEAGITAWVDGFGTVEDRATNLFTTTLNPLAQNFGQTMLSEFRKGGDALDVVGNIGMQMFDAFITNAINYGMQWLITQGLIKTGLLSTKALGTTIRAAETTETIAAEGAKTPILTTNAGLAAAGSFGASAIIGIAALVAAMAALGGFMQGGYTGGRRNETRGVVHGEEYVFDADTVRAIGLAPLEQMHATQSLPMLPVPVGGGGSDGGGSSMMAAREDPMVKHTTVNMHPGQRRRKVLDDPNTRYELREWLREDYGL